MTQRTHRLRTAARQLSVIRRLLAADAERAAGGWRLADDDDLRDFFGVEAEDDWSDDEDGGPTCGHCGAGLLPREDGECWHCGDEL